MSNIRIRRDHHLGLTNAKTQLDHLAQTLKNELHANYEWSGDKLMFKRSGASGTIEVGQDVIDINIKLGMALRLVKGKIENTINRELDAMLGEPEGSSPT